MQSLSKPLIWLASASPRRSALLTQIRVPHAVRAVDIDEQYLPPESPAQYVTRLAQSKADALWDRLAGAGQLVLGSDTTVAIDEQILGKPVNEEDEVRMLRLLSGRTHQVCTAVALRHTGGCEVKVSTSDVTFRSVAPDEIRAYWQSGEPADKAGGYAVQGLAAVFIERICGSYSGIMGLPLHETAQLLSVAGWNFDAAMRVNHEVQG